MNFLKRFWTRKPLELPVDGLRFLREQDGEPERCLKSRAGEVFKRYTDVKCAYLVQAINGDKLSVMLCISSRLDNPNTDMVREISKIFAEIFNPKEYLDILFISKEQESQIINVCIPFYRLPTSSLT